MIRVVGIDRNGYPRDLGIEEGTIESITELLEGNEFTILSIEEH